MAVVAQLRLARAGGVCGRAVGPRPPNLAIFKGGCVYILDGRMCL